MVGVFFALIFREEYDMFKLNSINLVGESNIGGKIAVLFSASIPEVGTPTFSKTIMDIDLYQLNETECEEDYKKFEIEALKYLKK